MTAPAKAHEVPPRLSGYNIIAVLPRFRVDGTIEPNVKVILGHDSHRRYPAYVTAMVRVDPAEAPPTEWFWGHYFDGYVDSLKRATKDLVARAQLPGVTVHQLDACEHEPHGETQHCSDICCPNYVEKHR